MKRLEHRNCTRSRLCLLVQARNSGGYSELEQSIRAQEKHYSLVWYMLILPIHTTDFGTVEDREKALARKRYSSVIGSSTQSNCREENSQLSTEKESKSCYQNPVAIETDDVKGACSKRTPIEDEPGSYLLPDLRRGEAAGSKEKYSRKERQFESMGTQRQDINANKAVSSASAENDRKSSVVLVSRAETGEACFRVKTTANKHGSCKPASRRVSGKKHEESEMHF